MARDVIESIASIPNVSDNFSEVYWVVNRPNGRMIERMTRRLNEIDCGGVRQVLLDDQVFMDSTISYDNPIDIESIEDNGDGTATVEITDHGFNSGEVVVLSCADDFDGSYPVTIFNTITNYWGVSGIANTSGFPLSGFSDDDLLEIGMRQPVYNCIFLKMVVRLATAPGSGKSRVFTLRKNSTNTDIKVTITGTNTTGSSTGSVSFGTTYFDYASIKEELFSGATESSFSVAFVVETPSDYQPIISGWRSNSTSNKLFNGTATNLFSPVINNAVTNRGISAQVSASIFSIFATNGFLKNYRVLLESAVWPGFPLRTSSYSLDVYDIGGAYDESGLAFSILGEVLTGQDTSTSLNIDAGQLAYITYSYSNAGPGSVFCGEFMEFHPDNSGERIYDCHARVSSGINRYHSGVGQTFAADGSSTETFTVMPMSGTIKNLYISGYGTAPDASNPLTITIRKNGVDTSLAVTITNPSTSGSNLVNTISVIDGDLISIKIFSNTDPAGSSAWKVGWTFVSSNTLQTPLFFNSMGNETSFNDSQTSTGTFSITLNAQAVSTYIGGGLARLADDTFTGLDHLEGETVKVLADGNVLDDEVMSGGLISLPASYGIVHVGLGYYSDLETLNVEIGSDRDTTTGKKIKVGNVSLSFVDSIGGWLGDSESTIYEAFTNLITTYNQSELIFNEDLTTLNSGTVLYTGTIRRPLNSKFKYGARVFFRNKDPRPVLITAISPECHIGGT